MEHVVSESSQTASYGLRHEVLSPMETLAQSVSTMAPTTTPRPRFPWSTRWLEWYVARVPQTRQERNFYCGDCLPGYSMRWD